MIYEYAFDPEFLGKLAKLGYKHPFFLGNEWGPGTHRFCLKLLDNWTEIPVTAELSLREKTLYEYYYSKIVKGARIERNIEKVNWDGGRKWVENISQLNDANLHFPVRMAFANNHPKGRPFFTVSDLGLQKKRTETEFLGLWKPEEYDEEKDRTAANLAELLKVFLCASSSITWIDPHIKMAKRYIVVFKEIFDLIARSGEIYRIKHNFKVITKYDEEGRDIRDFWEKFDTRIVKYIPRNTTLTIILADEGTSYKFHDRYMISELGGFEFPGGTDERPFEDRWSINLMTKNKWVIKTKYYSNIVDVNENDTENLKIREIRVFAGK